jgi:fibronectin-binding autotransporter adhesin
LGKTQADEINFLSTYFGGSISDLRIWNNTLSAADIASHYSNPAGADGLAVWTGSIGDNFIQAAKWDTGVVPGANTTLVIVNGNTMDLNGSNGNVGGVSLYNGTIQDSLGTGKLTSATTINVEQGTISAKLDGTAGLAKSTANTVILSGANTFSGGVTVNAGTLQLGNSAALGSTSNTVTVNGGSILNIQGNSPSITGIVLASGSLMDTGSSLGAISATGTYELQSGSVSLILNGTAGLNKTTTGTVTINGPSTSISNAYTGGTTVTAGTLTLADAFATLGKNSAGNDVTVMSGARLEMANSANIGSLQNLTIQTGAVATINAINQGLINKLGVSGYGVLAMNADNSSNLNFNAAACLSPVSLGAAGSTTLNYSGTITPYANTFRLGGAGGTLNVTGPLQDGTPARSLIVNGGGTGGTVILAGANTYSAGTTVVTGTLQVAASSSLGSNISSNTVTIQNGGTLNLAQATNIGSAQPLTINSGGVVSIAFPITTAFLAKPTPDSAGTIAVSGNSADPLTFTSGVSIGASAASTLSGTITPYNNTYCFGSGGAVLTVTSGLADGTNPCSLVIAAGAGSNTNCVTLNPDPVNFPAGNTYSGGTTVNGGYLMLGSGVALPKTGTLTINSGTADLNSQAVTVGRLVLNSGTLTGGTLTATLGDFVANSGTISSSLNDYTDPNTSLVTPRNLVKSTTGLLTLSGANNFTGKIYVNQGTLQVTYDGAYGAVPAAVVPDSINLADGTQLNVNQFDMSTTRGVKITGMVTINAYSGTSICRFMGPISGTGGFTLIGGDPFGIGNPGDTSPMWNTYQGDTIVTSGSTLRFRETNSLPYGAGYGNLYILDGGYLDLMYSSNVNGFYGAGIVENYTGNGTVLTVGNNNADSLFSGSIGAGLGTSLNRFSITKVGTGTLTLTGTSSGYTRLPTETDAATTIDQGTLAVMKLANGGALSSIGQSEATSNRLVIGDATSTSPATLKYIGTGDTTDRSFTIGLSAAFDASGTGPIQFLPATGSTMAYIGTGVHTVTLTGTNTGNNIMNVILTDTDSPTNLVKSGTGTWMSTINHSYTGNTTVYNGILSLAAINTPNATVSVAVGELDATSIVANTLTIGNGATVVIKAIPGGPQAGMESLSPVPEPSTWALLILAALVFSIYRRRSR